MMIDVTLQINLSPGDVNYAALTVPALVSNHFDIKERLLVVDCCRPQKTKLVNPDLKFPKEIFEKRVKKIIEISEKLLQDNVVTKVHYLFPDDPLYKSLSKKYLNNLYDCTHSAGGTANMSYWAGIELCTTKYVLHYDGDIILYQKRDYSWVNEALSYLNKQKDALIAVPRLSPPFKDTEHPSAQEGRPYTTFDNYWLNDWFSTRHFLIDKEKLHNYLPLVRGKVKIELLLRKFGQRAFPIDPEMLLFKSLSARGCKRLMLKSKDAWITHPTDKPASYIEILDKIIGEVSKGNFPDEQEGYENINLDAWRKFIETKKNE